MRYLFLSSIFLLFVACSSNPNLQSQKLSKDFSLADFQKSFMLTGAIISPDGNSVFYITNKDQYPKIWKIDLKSNTDQLFYNLDRPISSIYMSPSGQYIILQADQNGDENHEIFSLNISTRKLTTISRKPGTRNAMCSWSPDGKQIAYSSNERSAGAFDIYLASLAEDGSINKGPDVLLQSDNINDCGKFSPDGKQYAFIRFLTNSSQEIHKIDLISKKSYVLTPKKVATYSGIAWLSNSNEVISSSNVKTDFTNLISIDVASKKMKLLSSQNWNTVDFFNDSKANLSSVAVNEDGYISAKVFEKDLKKEMQISGLPKGIVTIKDWSKDGTKIIASVETTAQPVEIFLIDRKTNQAKSITSLNQSPVPKEDIMESELVHIKSEDGVQVSNWLMKPRSEKKNGMAVVFVHGGPEDQVLANYSFYRQYFLSRGITIIVPNFRGSTGYGTKFRKMVYQDWGGGHIKDLMASRNYLIQKEGFKPNKVSILGGSFGGFSVLSSITQHPESYCAAVDIFGPANLFSFISAVPAHWRAGIVELLGDPEKDKERLQRTSPFFSIDKIKTPLLVVQGANDPRVKKEESDHVVEKLRSLGKPVEYIVFPDEGHGFSKNENQIRAFEAAGAHILKFCK